MEELRTYQQTISTLNNVLIHVDRAKSAKMKKALAKVLLIIEQHSKQLEKIAATRGEIAGQPAIAAKSSSLQVQARQAREISNAI